MEYTFVTNIILILVIVAVMFLLEQLNRRSPAKTNKVIGLKDRRFKLTEEEKSRVRNAKGAETVIAKRFGISRARVGQIRRGKK